MKKYILILALLAGHKAANDNVTKLPTKYIISPVTTYNEDNLLFETKIGLNDAGMTLLFIACGFTADISRARAQQLIIILECK